MSLIAYVVTTRLPFFEPNKHRIVDWVLFYGDQAFLLFPRPNCASYVNFAKDNIKL